MKYVFLSILALTLLLSCQKVTEGKIVNKYYEPAERNLIFVSQKVGDIIIMTPYWVYDDEDFILEIEYWHIKKEKYKTRNFYVDEPTFNSAEVNDFYQAKSEEELSDKHEKTKKRD